MDTDRLKYRSLVGAVLYLAGTTRPDILTAVGVLSRFMEHPKVGHWNAAQRLLRYLRGTQELGIKFNGQSPNPTTLYGYSDADWANDPDTRRSITGYCFFLAGGCIIAKSKLQPVIATSTMVAEWIASYFATTEAIWLRKLLKELGFEQKLPTVIYGDNQGAIAISENPESHQRSKHIDVKYRYVRECVEAQSIKMDYINTSDMIADLLTKGLDCSKFEKHRKHLVQTIEHRAHEGEC